MKPSSITRLVSVVFLGVLLALRLGAAPVNIGSRLELFVDRTLVDTLKGVELRLQTPQPLPLSASPVRGVYMTVIKDGDLYRAYYRANDKTYTGPKGDGNPGELTCYAESKNGHDWIFPNLGLFEVDGSRHNNVILAQAPPFSHNFSPFLDLRPGVDARERFKALAGSRADILRRVAPELEGGLYGFVSADGIHWRRSGTRPIIPYQKMTPAGETRFDSQNVAFWSVAEQRYVCYYRTLDTPHGPLRTITRTTSPDFVTWSEPVAMRPNLPDEHLYTSQTHPYFRAPHIYIALPTRFQSKRGSSTDILFMSSRAGSNVYDRLFAEAFIRPGLDVERWGNRSNYAALNVIPTSPTEMSIYHEASGVRYVLRTDGFVAATAGARAGELVTKPFVYSGKELVVNYSTSAGGSLRMEVLHEDGTALPGLRLEECAEIIGDEIERVVRWKTESRLGELAGRPVRLRFVMVECDLYSFRFR